MVCLAQPSQSAAPWHLDLNIASRRQHRLTLHTRKNDVCRLARNGKTLDFVPLAAQAITCNSGDFCRARAAVFRWYRAAIDGDLHLCPYRAQDVAISTCPFDSHYFGKLQCGLPTPQTIPARIRSLAVGGHQRKAGDGQQDYGDASHIGNR